MSAAALAKAVNLGEMLIVLDGYVLNIGTFVDEHPGGDSVRARARASAGIGRRRVGP